MKSFNQFLIKPNLRALVVVNSPYQALCAIEALHFFDITAAFFIACVTGSPRDNQLYNFLNKKSIDYSIYNVSKKNKLAEIIKAGVTRRGKDYDFSIIGDCANIWNKIAAIYYLKKGAFVMFSDDGNNTMSYLQGKNRKKITINSIIGKLIMYFVSKYNRLSFTNVFFTQYYDVALPKFKCYPNNFTKALDITGSSFERKNVYIVGTNIEIYCSKLNLSYEEYSNYLSDLFAYIKKSYVSEKIIYIPHGKDNLPIAKLKCEEDNILFTPIDTTIELYILEKKIYPTAIYGYTSTSLLNFKKLFPDTHIYNVCCHQIKSNPYREEYESFSSYFSKHGIKKINQTDIMI